MNLPDPNTLFEQLVAALRPRVGPDTALIGIHTGGVWLAEALHAALGLTVPLGTLDVAFYRDDYHSRGLHAKPRRSDMPFDVNGRHLIIVDDVLYTGRTTRAALNEIFDYGRPGCVELAVLVDRGERQLPIAPTYCAHILTESLPAGALLRLSRAESGEFILRLVDANDA